LILVATTLSFIDLFPADLYPGYLVKERLENIDTLRSAVTEFLLPQAKGTCKVKEWDVAAGFILEKDAVRLRIYSNNDGSLSVVG